MRLHPLGAAATTAALMLAGLAPAGAAAGDVVDVTLLATTDVHGHVFNWDYFRDSPYATNSALGLSRAATIVEDIRSQAADPDSVLVFDNGDAIQGTPLTYLAAEQPDVLGISQNPMAIAYNAMGYDAQTLGNHEFNYGLDTLATYAGQLDFPLLGANVVQAGTGEPAYEPYTLIDREIDGHTVTIGVLGLVTPGVAVWDRANVEGVLEFRDMVATAQEYVPEMKAAGADIVVALAHTGQDPAGAVWDPADLGENVATSLATNVNDLDVVVAGHSHVENAQVMFQAPDGDPVLLTQPNYWARSVSEVDLSLVEQVDGTFAIDWESSGSQVHAATTVADSPTITGNADLTRAHEATVAYVNTVVAQSTEEMTTASARYEDTPILDFIGDVMTTTVEENLTGTEYADLPVVAQVSPFSRTAVFPQGDVTIKDIAGLYIYDNTLGAVLLTGAQVREYLEYSARYFCQVPDGEAFDPATDTGCLYPGATRGIPDYNYDALTGVNYEINVSRPVGERIENLRLPDGTPLADDAQVVLAVNNYRQNGGGGYPAVANAPVVWNDLLEIRQLLIEKAQAVGVIDPANFFMDNWEVVTDTPAADFTDVPPSQPFYDEIAWVAQRGISTGWENGDGTSSFRPLDSITRDAMAAFLYRLAGSPEWSDPAVSPFVDVPVDQPFYHEITWLAAQDIAEGWSGVGGAEFRPETFITRDAMAAFLYRFAEWENGSASIEWSDPAVSPFVDVPVSQPFYTEITWLASEGISTGWQVPMGAEYRPEAFITRDAMAAFLYRLDANVLATN